MAVKRRRSSLDEYDGGDLDAMDPEKLSVISCLINTSKQRVKKQSAIPACPELQKDFPDQDFIKAQGRPFSADMKVRVILCDSVKQIYSITNDKKPHGCLTRVIQFDELNHAPSKRRRHHRHHQKQLAEESVHSNDGISYMTKKLAPNGEIIYDYRSINQAIKDNFGITKFSYVQVVRVSSDQDSAHKQLIKNQKVLKLNVIPKPIDRFHHTKYIKADICYPRYKAMMTIYVVPYDVRRQQHYYTTQLLMDQDERITGLVDNADYYGPEQLGLPIISMHQRVKIAEAVRRQHKRQNGPDPWYVRDQILHILQHQHRSNRQYNSNETAAISVLLNGMATSTKGDSPQRLSSVSSASSTTSCTSYASDDEVDVDDGGSSPPLLGKRFKRIPVNSFLQ